MLPDERIRVSRFSDAERWKQPVRKLVGVEEEKASVSVEPDWWNQEEAARQPEEAARALEDEEENKSLTFVNGQC